MTERTHVTIEGGRLDEPAARSPGRRPLEGQWAVITGGSKGIGRAIAGQLAAQGANLVLVARDVEALSLAVNEISEDSIEKQEVRQIAADVASRSDLRGLFARLRAELPALNIFVANAGTGRYIPFLEISDDDWDENVAINQTSAFICCQEAARIMLAQPVDNRVILLVSSIRAGGVRPNVALYGITKAALNQLGRQAAYELAPLGIRVNVLSPGLTVTPMVLQNTPEVYDKARSLIPMERPGSPEDMAQAAAYLCSPAAAFVTGANLVVDGGESLW
jgi:NAD(P)-dependent dehydrogenase (short-subunit alcohol dehydrogenase family)